MPTTINDLELRIQNVEKAITNLTDLMNRRMASRVQINQLNVTYQQRILDLEREVASLKTQMQNILPRIP